MENKNGFIINSGEYGSPNYATINIADFNKLEYFYDCVNLTNELVSFSLRERNLAKRVIPRKINSSGYTCLATARYYTYVPSQLDENFFKSGAKIEYYNHKTYEDVVVFSNPLLSFRRLITGTNAEYKWEVMVLDPINFSE